MFNFISRLFCKHENKTFLYNYDDKELPFTENIKSVWFCDDCGKALNERANTIVLSEVCDSKKLYSTAEGLTFYDKYLSNVEWRGWSTYGYTVILDFTDIEHISPTFINGAFIPLLKHMIAGEVSYNIDFRNIRSIDNLKISIELGFIDQEVKVENPK